MDTIISQPQETNPTTTIKSTDKSLPSVLTNIDEQSFKKFIPSGIKVRVNVPVLRTTNRAIFAINIDGFIPQFNLGDISINTIFRNLFPVQVFENAIDYVTIFQEQLNIPIQTHYICHRLFSGSVNVGIRVTSNTTQTGTFMITQASTCIRNYYRNATPYRGLKFLNTSEEGTDYAVDSFVLGDLSINRNWGISTIGKPNLPKTDLAQKLWYLYSKQSSLVSDSNLLIDSPFLEQFTEDWLFFTPITNIPNQNGGQIDFEIFFDYSNITFYMPMLPYLALPNLNSDQQILNFSQTFNDRDGSINRNDFVYGFPINFDNSSKETGKTKDRSEKISKLK
uniref:Structural protein 3 n=1 Tax=Chipolycivirus sp. TaxID=2809300 RepID=A0AAU8JNL0_9VIRU